MPRRSYWHAAVHTLITNGHCNNNWSRARLVACEESNQALGSQEAVDWIPGLPHFLGPHAHQSSLHTGPGDTSESSVSTGPASGGAQREASPARLGKERETLRRFVARAITFRHRPTSAISLSSHSPLPNRWTISLPPPTTAPTEEALLPRRFLASSSRRPCLASKGSKHLAAHQPPPAKCR
jgi:hypothetical protein